MRSSGTFTQPTKLYRFTGFGLCSISDNSRLGIAAAVSAVLPGVPFVMLRLFSELNKYCYELSNGFFEPVEIVWMVHF